jgi:hypothetical protein
MIMRNAMTHIAADKGVDILLKDARRDKSYRTKGTGGGYSALL